MQSSQKRKRCCKKLCSEGKIVTDTKMKPLFVPNNKFPENYFSSLSILDRASL